MELKRKKVAFRKIKSIVLIEPLWNWNIIGFLEQRKNGRVLIEPLWNWNYWIDWSIVKNQNCLNRTFMELKLRLDVEEAIRRLVLIEPLWNWNYVGVPYIYGAWGLNRTFMELKQTSGGKEKSLHDSLNRTFMELKLMRSLKSLLIIASLNRTFMELKHQ